MDTRTQRNRHANFELANRLRNKLRGAQDFARSAQDRAMAPSPMRGTSFTFPSNMKNFKSGLAGGLTVAFLAMALAPEGRAEERMNGMVGLFYSSYNLVGFEYDLILQFQKSKNWLGNISGFYISNEIFPRANRMGVGFVLGQRADEKGTFAASITGFGENRFSRFSKFDWGAEAKITLAVFGVKMGIINKEKLFVEAGLSY